MDNSDELIDNSEESRGQDYFSPLPGEGLGVRLFMGDYDDIIHLPHHVSKRHPQMSMLNRAAQFAPFAALTGYDDAIRERGRETDEWREPGEAESEELNRSVARLMERIAEQPRVRVTFFRPDERKRGGTYSVWNGRVKRIDEHERRLCLTDGRSIPMDFITQIEIVC